MPQALAGLRVVDFSHVMAGPFATNFLRLLGAEVIKVETPGRGDLFRNYDPDPRYEGMSPAFIAANAGKKSICLDLKSPRDLEVARRLIGTADVVVENAGGLTSLEAFAAGVPVVSFDPIPGHGRDNVRGMVRAGVTTSPDSLAGLCANVAELAADTAARRRQLAAVEAMFDRDPIDSILELISSERVA